MKFLAAFIVLTAPLVATDAASSQSSHASAAANATSETIGEGADKVICRREKVSGSRVTAKRVCQTAAQWERQRREDQQAVEKVQNARSKSS